MINKDITYWEKGGETDLKFIIYPAKCDFAGQTGEGVWKQVI